MNKNTIKILLILYSILILLGSTIPGGSIPTINIWPFDKLLHIIEYFILAILMINVLRIINVRSIIIVIIIGIVYGGFSEIWQGTVAGRDASIYDAIAKGIGMIIGSLFSFKFKSSEQVG